MRIGIDARELCGQFRVVCPDVAGRGDSDRLADPMLDMRLLCLPAFSVALALYALATFIAFGTFIFVGQYLQLVLGLSPLQAGLLSLPASVLAIAGPMLSPLMVQHIGTRLSVAGLLFIAAVGFGVLTLVGAPLAALTVAVGWALWAFGGSAAATLTTGTIIGSAPPERAGAVSALAIFSKAPFGLTAKMLSVAVFPLAM